MTEHLAPHPTAEQASRIIAADIKAYPHNGPDKREEDIRLYSELLSREVIEAAWAQRYAEIAKPAPFRRRWPPQTSFFVPPPQPEAELEAKDTEKIAVKEAVISKGIMARLGAIADQGVEYDDEEDAAAAEPEQRGQLIPFEPEPEDDEASPPVYTPKDIIKLNRQHAVIANLGGKCVIMEFVPSNVTPGTTEPAYQTFTSFRERYLNQYVYDGGGKRMSLGQFWLAHQRRRQYEGLDLVPHGPEVLPGNIFNLWRGWGVDPKEGDWSLLRKHVDEVLADGDPKFAEYILHWIAEPCRTTRSSANPAWWQRQRQGSLGRCVDDYFWRARPTNLRSCPPYRQA
jgi:hypothetical protein